MTDAQDKVQSQLETLRTQVKKYAKSEKRRLETERDWLKSIPTGGLDDTANSNKETDRIMTLLALDDLLGR